MLAGKFGVVFGVVNRRSIAWGVAQALHAEGCNVAIGIANDRFRPAVEKLAMDWSPHPTIVTCDVRDDASIHAAFHTLMSSHTRRLHVLVHSIAYASQSAMRGNLYDISRADFAEAHDVSTYSFLALVQRAIACGMLGMANSDPTGAGAPPDTDGASLMALSYIGAVRAVPQYRVMGPAKASLEACCRQLATELGPHRIRVNAISAGPIETSAARGIAGFTDLRLEAEKRAPLRAGVTLESVGRMASFLAGPGGVHITGQTMYVDSGMSAVL